MHLLQVKQKIYSLNPFISRLLAQFADLNLFPDLLVVGSFYRPFWATDFATISWRRSCRTEGVESNRGEVDATPPAPMPFIGVEVDDSFGQ